MDSVSPHCLPAGFIDIAAEMIVQVCFYCQQKAQWLLNLALGLGSLWAIFPGEHHLTKHPSCCRSSHWEQLTATHVQVEKGKWDLMGKNHPQGELFVLAASISLPASSSGWLSCL